MIARSVSGGKTAKTRERKKITEDVKRDLQIAKQQLALQKDRRKYTSTDPTMNDKNTCKASKIPQRWEKEKKLK